MAEASNDDPGSKHNLNEKIVREAIERQISLGRLDIAIAIEERFQSCDKSSTDGIMIDQVNLDTQADEEEIVAKSTFDGIVQYLHLLLLLAVKPLGETPEIWWSLDVKIR